MAGYGSSTCIAGGGDDGGEAANPGGDGPMLGEPIRVVMGEASLRGRSSSSIGAFASALPNALTASMCRDMCRVSSEVPIG